MWESNQNAGGFDAGFAGDGGFMNNSSIDTPGKSGPKKAARGSQCLAAVTCRMLLDNANQEGLVIEGFRVNMLKLVGLIRKVDESSIKITYTIDDHTGQMEVTSFVEDSDDGSAPTTMALAEGQYAKVFGNIRWFNGKPSITCFKMFQIEDPNLITTHLLEVIHQSQMLLKLSNGQGEGVSNGNDVVKPVLENSTLAAIPAMPGAGGGNKPEDVVVNIIKKQLQINAMCPGVSKDLIKNSAPEFTNAQIEKAVDYLLGQGMIYSSMDEDHFLLIDG